LLFFYLILPSPRSTLFPTRRSSDLLLCYRTSSFKYIISQSLFSINETVKIKPFITKIANGNNEVNKDIIIFAFSRSKLALNKGKDRKSTRLNSSHVSISYAVFCLKK